MHQTAAYKVSFCYETGITYADRLIHNKVATNGNLCPDPLRSCLIYVILKAENDRTSNMSSGSTETTSVISYL